MDLFNKFRFSEQFEMLLCTKAPSSEGALVEHRNSSINRKLPKEMCRREKSLRHFQRGKKMKKLVILFLFQKFQRINALGIAADGKMDMVADAAFQQRGIAHIADGLTCLYRIPGADSHILR